jgi:nickel-dependent lactate racemase
MVFAARTAGLAFILNVVIDSDKKVINAFAGDLEKAHEEGCRFLKEHAVVPRAEADIVVTSNAGYPLDQNVYQAVKGMSAAERCRQARRRHHHRGPVQPGPRRGGFLPLVQRPRLPEAVYDKILSIPQMETIPDQWEAQILARILKKAAVVLVADPEMKTLIEEMHMTYAETLDEALSIARQKTGDAKITVIPDGVGVIVG